MVTNNENLSLLSYYLKGLDDYEFDNENLFEELRKEKCINGKKNIIEKIINNNLKLVYSIAMRIKKNNSIDLLDLIQEGNLGLYKAIEKYNGELGFRFSVYATWWIKKSIYDFLSKNSNFLSIPSHIFIDIKKVEEFSKKFIEENGRQPEKEDIQQKLKINKKKLGDILNIYIKYFKNTNINEDENQDNFIENNMNILLRNEETPETILMENSRKQTIKKLLDEHLDSVERDILKMRFGIDYDARFTLQEIEEKINTSKENIRRIEKKAIEKLKKHISEDFL